MTVKGLVAIMAASMRNGSIDGETVRGLAERLIQKGVNGIFILGTNGEFHVSSREGKVKLATVMVGYADCKVPMYTGNDGNSIQEVIELSQALQQTGITALNIIAPFLASLSQQELSQHYKVVADTINIPAILYSIPKNTGNNIEPQTAVALACHDNVVGIKDNSDNIEQVKQYIELIREMEFAVLSGSDSLILKALGLGAKGAVTATSNLLTDIDMTIIRYFEQGELAEARMIQEKIGSLRKVLKLGSIPSVLRATMNMAGITAGECRKPIIMPDRTVSAEIREMLQYYMQEGEM